MTTYMLARICVRLKWICSTFPIDGGKTASLTDELVELLLAVEEPTLAGSSPGSNPAGGAFISAERGQPPLNHSGDAQLKRVQCARRARQGLALKGGGLRAEDEGLPTAI